ncbi:MAG: metallophosphoesterase [Actinomycetota bacterium]
MRSTRAALPLAAATAFGGYALVEPRLYRLVRHRLPMAPGVPPLRILHVSDTHARAGDAALFRFLRALPGLVGTPDLVVATGDLIENDGGIDPIVEALALLEARLGRFYVLGSHDYYQARYQGLTKYFTRSAARVSAPKADVRRLEGGLGAKGWVALTNHAAVLESEAGAIRVAGVDDPYLRRHRTDHIERRGDEVAAIALTHAPDVVSEWLLRGFDLVCAGHTHGGQVRIPLVGAVVTNSTLPSALASGPHPIGNGWLHVSPGLGTSHFAPIRFLCRPEATLLELEPSRIGAP